MNQSITIKFNAWIICAVLLLTNLITIGLWQPWAGSSVSDRTIVITGTTTIESEPDQFVFSPYYQKEGTDRTEINTELGELSKTIVEKLKALGVKDSAIKTDAGSYDYGIYEKEQETNVTATLSITVTLKDKTLAQKVQDYLVTTSPSGSVTPQISFSTAKQKELETEARTAALKDAKSKAEANVKQLGARLGKVIKVSDITSGGITPLPWMLDASRSSEPGSADGSVTSSSYSIQPGLNEYSFSVEVTYELD
jgi:uncharacterized protein YggE